MRSLFSAGAQRMPIAHSTESLMQCRPAFQPYDARCRNGDVKRISNIRKSRVKVDAIQEENVIDQDFLEELNRVRLEAYASGTKFIYDRTSAHQSCLSPGVIREALIVASQAKLHLTPVPFPYCSKLERQRDGPQNLPCRSPTALWKYCHHVRRQKLRGCQAS